jgi:hypothetical protein
MSKEIILEKKFGQPIFQNIQLEERKIAKGTKSCLFGV